MYYRLDEEELERVNEVSELTGVDYDLQNNFIPVDSLIEALKDLLIQYHKKEKEITDLQQDMDENYEVKKINYYEEYGISEKDFI